MFVVPWFLIDMCFHDNMTGSWIHPKEREEEERKEALARAKRSSPTPKVSIPISSLPPPIAVTKQKVTNFSTAEKQELQNVKQLCLTVMKGQKRLVREVGRVKNTVERTPALVDAESKAKVAPQSPQLAVTIKDVKELEEMQKRNLKAHLIALDMKEQGRSIIEMSSGWNTDEEC